MSIVTHQSRLPDESSKEDVYALVDNASVGGITNDDISPTTIDQSKLATIKTPGKIDFSSLVITNQATGDILYSSDGVSFIRLAIGTEGQKLVAGAVVDNMEYVMNYKGSLDASSGTYPSNPSKSDYYYISVAGTISGTAYDVGDLATYNGSAWERLFSTDGLAQEAYLSNALATGGTIKFQGGKVTHIFKSSGTFTPLIAGTAEILVVGGGGGGGRSSGNNGGGGGGGGKVTHNLSFPISAQGYSVVVGNGGAAGSVGSSGGSSSFSTLSSSGGGGGSVSDGMGGTSGNGNAGGIGMGAEGASNAGGGGGDGSAGENSPGTRGGNGGTGTYINGASYGGGGGGGSESSGEAGGTGFGGGGNGGTGGQNGTVGTDNTGGGGGGSGGGATSGAGGSGIVIISYTPILAVYSDISKFTQGNSSLKIVANKTDSLNKTLTRTCSPTIDLTDINTLTFDIYAFRTGSNIKIGLHNNNGTLTEITPEIVAINTWQTVNGSDVLESWSIASVANADKNAIDSIIITILNADADNTFYIDNFNSTDIRWRTV